MCCYSTSFRNPAARSSFILTEEQRFGKLTLTTCKLGLFSQSAACILIFFRFVLIKECSLYQTPVVTGYHTTYNVSSVSVKLQDIPMFLHAILCLGSECTMHKDCHAQQSLTQQRNEQ